MKRRTFIQNTALATAALSTFPQWATAQETLDKDQLLGKGSPKLVERNGYRLRPQVAAAFDKMTAAAQQDGIGIQVVSSYRDYAHQNRIWERKFKSYTGNGMRDLEAIKKIIEYSTIPGTSRHHWATDLDIIQSGTGVTSNVLDPDKFHGTGPFCELKAWLDKHAESFGFYEVYTNDYGRKGFNYEPWHFSYAPLSAGYLQQYTRLDIAQILQQEKLLGSDAFTAAFINQYKTENILDINPALLD
ncbi:D-alanyl-D-alanine carboxypeptidase-like protein [Leeuwenhoekiella aestuarii]|uniref:D-alanyl-D-alanine carboxypeptidase-like protein n=1 Tax=Leeuwenhoekiella aestuarii TaxID=2249426 RepID=A0A4Q0NQ65_9FLAO|nr:M15 family metallopeptidase [Leeuwenhoekiella aestuarii]RXG12408.1 D-alanyl-D-alanine carboxypeptidase-like protein [Leeuwenhoekiella aestuarii]RXG13840.1 D-alanyl-D-alanine carboxypeptidase-like protein [Leeuwenhoekiella aestuarii]